jgi:hypothetical protein
VKAELQKGRPTKGKIYHLAIMSYMGPDDLPIDRKKLDGRVRDYRWVNEKEAKQLKQGNLSLVGKTKGYSELSLRFHVDFFEKILKIHNDIGQMYLQKSFGQKPLL